MGWLDTVKHAAAQGMGSAESVAQHAAEDARAHPLGTAGLVVATVSAAPAVIIAASGAATVAPVAYGAVAATDALGVTHGARKQVDEKALWLVEHPGQVGEAVTVGELALAASAAGGPLGAAVGKVAPKAFPSSTPADVADTARAQVAPTDSADTVAQVQQTNPAAVGVPKRGVFARAWASLVHALTGQEW